jgi:3-isopropylmalate dehydrogenase
MMLRHSFGMTEEAALVEKAVRMVLKEGFRTEDIRQEGAVVVGTQEMGDLVVGKVRTLPA